MLPSPAADVSTRNCSSPGLRARADPFSPLAGMSRREVQNKIAVAVFAVCMVGIIALVIYFIVKNKQQSG